MIWASPARPSLLFSVNSGYRTPGLRYDSACNMPHLDAASSNVFQTSQQRSTPVGSAPGPGHLDAATEPKYATSYGGRSGSSRTEATESTHFTMTDDGTLKED